MLNQFFSQFNRFAKNLLVVRLISVMVFASLHPTLAYAQTQVIRPASVVVAVIDEGVDFNHPDLKDYQWKNEKEIPSNNIDDDHNGYVDDVYGWNFLDNNNNLEIKGGHGTKLSGLIAPGANIMPLIVCAKDFGCSQPAIINAIYYAVNNGANVINLSLGDTSGYKNAYDESVKYAYSHNVVIAASSGNSQTGYSLDKEPMSPICNDNQQNMVLGVGTVDEKGNRPYWANYGSCIDISALGSNIKTTASFKYNPSGYATVEGNSYSTALVSRKVAEYIQNHKDSSAKDTISYFSPIAKSKVVTAKIVKPLKNQPKLVIR